MNPALLVVGLPPQAPTPLPYLLSSHSVDHFKGKRATCGVVGICVGHCPLQGCYSATCLLDTDRLVWLVFPCSSLLDKSFSVFVQTHPVI